MKIKFSNLGCIKEAELDLRPMTVIIGPNNSSKTYIAYSIYGLCKRARTTLRLSNKLEFNKEGEGSWSLKIDNNLINFFIKDAENIAANFQQGALESFFQDSSHKLFSRTLFKMMISRKEVEDAINQLNQETFFSADGHSITVSRQDNILFFKTELEEQIKNQLINNKKPNHFSNTINVINAPEIWFIFFVKQILFHDVLPFPAERNAFINTYKILENRRYKLLKESQRELFRSSGSERRFDLLKEQGDIRYTEPVEDFLDFLADLDIQDIKKINSIEKTSKKNDFQKLADEIENQLQNKNRTNLKATKLGGKEIKILVKSGLEIDLYNASSSIKQLAPLLLYLRFRASEGDFLVIDEPEMNLHPESQAKLLEALSILVNLGVRVLLTTHSPYIMAHLNNLVNGNHENPEILKIQSSSLYLKDERAFLPVYRVSAYEIKKNNLVSLNDPDYGIRWDTLSDVSVDIQQKFFEIYEAGQEKINDAEE